MKKLLPFVLLAAPCAFAEDIDFSGTAAASCTFTNVVAGSLIVTGTTFTTGSAATYTVTNNSAGAFKIVVPQVTSFASAPGLAVMSGDLSQTPAFASGDNSGNTFTGADSTGYETTLTKLGVDNLTHSVGGTITDAEAGTYDVTVPVTCVSV